MTRVIAVVAAWKAQERDSHVNDLRTSRWTKLLVSKWFSALGVIYVGASLYGSARFLGTASEFLSNDVFWPAYNASVGAVYVAAASNKLLRGHERATGVSLTEPRFTIAGMPITSMSVANTRHYSRLLQYHRMTSIEDGVAGLRSLPARGLLYVVSQYCWVDFDRRWSLAHTERRAERCLEKYAENAAVYLESALRNVQWEPFVQSRSSTFQIAIVNELELSAEGVAFLESVKMNGSTSIEEEAALWRSKNLTRYTLSYHNLWQLGVRESVDLATSLKLKATIPINDIDYENRWTVQTSMKMFWTMSNDFWAIASNGNTLIVNCSLIRNASNFFERQNITMEDVLRDDGDFPSPLTPTDALFRATVGPFGSIDMTWIVFPQALYDLVEAVEQVVYSIARDNVAFRAAFRDVGGGQSILFLPRRWANPTWRYVGGSPLCSTPFNLSYPIQQFQFDDNCAEPTAEENYPDSFAFVFAALTSGVDLSRDLVDLCEDVTPDSVICATSIGRAASLIEAHINATDRERISQLASTARREVELLNVSLMQVVERPQLDYSRGYALELEPVVSENTTSGRNIFGMLFLLEWATGEREAVLFEGDHGQMTLLSASSFPLSIGAANLPNSIAPYLLVAMQLITSMLMFVAMLVLVQSLRARFCIAGLNLLEFNRVSGVTWIGRPLLALRGLISLCILSSSTPTFVTDEYFTWMEEKRPHWFIKILTSGEATWLLCVVVDLMLINTQGLAYAFAPATHVVSWVIVALLEHLSPLGHAANFDQKCSFVQMEQQISCSSGTIAIGSPSRLHDILLICFGSLAVCFVIVRSCCRRLTRREDTALLPAIAREVFVTTGWLHDGDWYLDPASAVLSGLVSWKSGKQTKVVDVKSWTIFRNRQPKVQTSVPRELERAIRLKGLKVHCD